MCETRAQCDRQVNTNQMQTTSDHMHSNLVDLASTDAHKHILQQLQVIRNIEIKQLSTLPQRSIGILTRRTTHVTYINIGLTSKQLQGSLHITLLM